jgi:hypothetical protein
MKKFIISLFALVFFAGCSFIKETAKEIWGSSTRALDAARSDAVKKTFSCSYDQCFDAVLLYADKEIEIDDSGIQIEGMTKKPDAPVSGHDPNQVAEDPDKKKSLKRKNFDIFIKDRPRQRIVVINVLGAVNTTEVGIFFTAVEGKGTLIEVSSLSTAAKVKVSEMLFVDLQEMFKELN